MNDISRGDFRLMKDANEYRYFCKIKFISSLKLYPCAKKVANTLQYTKSHTSLLFLLVSQDLVIMNLTHSYFLSLIFVSIDNVVFFEMLIEKVKLSKRFMIFI